MGLAPTSAWALGLVLIASSAAGQPDHDGNDQHDHDRARALALFKKSEQRYEQGDLRGAIALLRDARQLYPEPLLLYNLAVAYEDLGELELAASAYKRFLDEKPRAEDRTDIERRIKTLETRIDARAQPVAPTPVVMPHPTSDDDESTSDGGSAYPWIVAGAGVATLGVGAGLLIAAHTRNDDAADEGVAVEAERLHDQATTLQTSAAVVMAVGGAAATAGLVWIIVDASASSAPAVGIRPAALSFSMRF